MRGLYFFPLTALFIVAFFLFLVFLFIFIQVGLIGYAYERLGISAHFIFPLLLLSLLGSSINIPVTQISGGPVVSRQRVDFFGMRYVIPFIAHHEQTVIAVNVGGAVVPTLISLYLLFTTGLFVRGLLGVAFVSAIVHRLARPVPGVGIAIPIFVPPLIAALTGLLLAPEHAPALAYVAGTMGCLIGADLLNLHRLAGLGAPVASIGGAGTFDGIFFTGIIAVLLT
jgi:uncharacterized membrane protein